MTALTLEKAISIASEAHSGQVDKNGDSKIIGQVEIYVIPSRLQ
jgi:hypothetical protein